MVSHATASSVGRRRSTGLNRAESGTSVAHQKGQCEATIAGRPTCQPKRTQSQATSACEATKHQAQACGKRGTRRSVSEAGIGR